MKFPHGGTLRLAEPRIALPSLAALALLLRLPRLGESLWSDEVLYSTHHGWGTWPALLQSFLTDPSAPLYRLLLFFWVELSGEHELAVRTPSLLFGIGSILLSYGLLRRRSGDETALLAGLLLAFSPAHVWYSQEATAYAMTLFLLVSAACLADGLVREPFSAARGALFALALVGVVFTHYYAAAFLLPFGLLALTAHDRARRWMLAAVACAGFAVAAALLAKHFGGHLARGQGFLRPFTLFEAWMLLFHWFLEGNALWTVSPYAASLRHLLEHPLLLVCQLGAGVLLLRGLFAGEERTRRAIGLDAAFLGTLPVALALAGLAGLRHLYVERYLLPVLLFFVPLLARGAGSIRRPLPRRAAAAALLALSAAGWIAWWQKPQQWTVYKPNPDWRATVPLLLDRTPANEGALVLGGAPLADLAFYVGRMGGRERLLVLEGRRLPADDSDLWRGRRTVHLVRIHHWKGGSDRLRDLLERNPRLRRVGSATAAGVEVLSYERH